MYKTSPGTSSSLPPLTPSSPAMFSRIDNLMSVIRNWRGSPAAPKVDATAGQPATPLSTEVCKAEVATVESATVLSPSPLPSTSPLPAAYYSPIQSQNDMMIDFFGARSRVREFQARPPSYSSHGDSERLPSYPDCVQDEPATLARYMFIYGFFFPPFWLMGIAILFSPLRSTPEWELGKTEEEKVILLNKMRVEEVKWAKKCLWATLTMLALFALTGLIVYLAVFRK